MLAPARQPKFFEHVFIYKVRAAHRGPQQPASSSHCGKRCRFVTCLVERTVN